ncbi:hypothetical protein [Kribbella sancticallisti]|uniref:hypothetical protein n=1 Tax=Kribbella sancticallisti TaxID=460087 RepID=UPI0031E15D51
MHEPRESRAATVSLGKSTPPATPSVWTHSTNRTRAGGREVAFADVDGGDEFASDEADVLGGLDGVRPVGTDDVGSARGGVVP